MTTTFPPSLQPFGEPVSSRYSSTIPIAAAADSRRGRSDLASGLGAVVEFGKRLAFGVRDVEDVGDAESAQPHLGDSLAFPLLVGFLGGLLADARGKDRNSLRTLLDVAAQRLPRMETGDTLGLGPLKENKQLVVEASNDETGRLREAKS